MGKSNGYGIVYSVNGLKEYEGNWKKGKKDGDGIQYE